MTKTTRTTKNSTAVAEEQSKATTEQQTHTLPAPSLDPDQARKDITAMFALAAKAAQSKAG
ncbi:MAG: hypothetical protein ABWY08_10280 [Comamonas sp.]